MKGHRGRPIHERRMTQDRRHGNDVNYEGLDKRKNGRRDEYDSPSQGIYLSGENTKNHGRLRTKDKYK